MKLNNWKQTLAAMIVIAMGLALPLAFAASPQAGILLTDRISNLENTVYGANQVTVPAVASAALAIPLNASNLPQVPLYTETNLTSAQVLALNTTPVQVVPALAGAEVVVGEVMLFQTNGLTTVVAGSGGAITFDYAGGTVNTLGSNVLAAATVGGQAVSTTTGYKIGPGANVTVTPDVGVVITQPTANFTSGASTTMQVIVKYNYYTHP